jgi:hypothetical protein
MTETFTPVHENLAEQPSAAPDFMNYSHTKDLRRRLEELGHDPNALAFLDQTKLDEFAHNYSFNETHAVLVHLKARLANISMMMIAIPLHLKKGNNERAMKAYNSAHEFLPEEERESKLDFVAKVTEEFLSRLESLIAADNSLDQAWVDNERKIVSDTQSIIDNLRTEFPKMRELLGLI